MTVTFEDDGKVIAQVTIEKGGKVFAPDYSKEGFELVWKTAARRLLSTRQSTPT